MYLSLFNKLVGTSALAGAAAVAWLGVQNGWNAAGTALFLPVVLGLLFFLPAFLESDEEELLLLNKIFSLALTVFAVGVLLGNPLPNLLIVSLPAAAVGIGGYALVLREQQALEREVCFPNTEAS